MGRRRSPDRAPGSRGRRYSWFSALVVWIVISLAGWAMIGGVIAVLNPEQASQVATEGDDEDLDKFAPAAGNDKAERE